MIIFILRLKTWMIELRILNCCLNQVMPGSWHPAPLFLLSLLTHTSNTFKTKIKPKQDDLLLTTASKALATLKKHKERVASKPPKQDTEQLFAEYLARTIRSISDERVRRHAEFRILSVLNDILLEEERRSPTSSNVYQFSNAVLQPNASVLQPNAYGLQLNASVLQPISDYAVRLSMYNFSTSCSSERR